MFFFCCCCLLHADVESHTEFVQWQPSSSRLSSVPSNVCFLCFLFKTLLRRWVYRLFLRVPLEKVMMWHWNARRTETPLQPASTSTLRWEIAGRVHSNHTGLSSPGSCCLPCILLYRLITPAPSLSLALFRARRSRWWTRMSTLWLALPEQTLACTSAPCLTTMWWSPLSLSPWAVSGWTMCSISLSLSSLPKGIYTLEKDLMERLTDMGRYFWHFEKLENVKIKW